MLNDPVAVVSKRIPSIDMLPPSATFLVAPIVLLIRIVSLVPGTPVVVYEPFVLKAMMLFPLSKAVAWRLPEKPKTAAARAGMMIHFRATRHEGEGWDELWATGRGFIFCSGVLSGWD